ncbi:MAG: hypothetical protein K0S38_1000 [Candidatus Paceibacter sp.]|jgi:hypothetical protein|nr:hypothetical protein [Candidatus Paceibacter sp.]
MNYKKIAYIAVLFIVGVVVGFMITRYNRQSENPPIVENTDNKPSNSGKLNGNPTTFSYVGNISFKADDTDVHGIPYFAYTESEGPKATTTLVFDPMSYCGSAGGFIECIAMNSTYTMAFNGKKAVVEGIRLHDGAEVLVRKLHLVQAGEEPRVPGTGQTFISWQQAKDFISSCSVKMVMQTHTLDVYLTMKDDTNLRAVEPMIDDVFKVVHAAPKECGNIGLATE